MVVEIHSVGQTERNIEIDGIDTIVKELENKLKETYNVWMKKFDDKTSGNFMLDVVNSCIIQQFISKLRDWQAWYNLINGEYRIVVSVILQSTNFNKYKADFMFESTENI